MKTFVIGATGFVGAAVARHLAPLDRGDGRHRPRRRSPQRHPGEAAGVWGEFGALAMGASSRLRAVSARNELGWRPEHTDMLSMVGESRLRKLAYTTDIDLEGDHNVRLHP